MRRALVVAQVAAAFALLYGAVSLLGTLVHLRRAELGFQPARAQTFRVTLPFAQYRGPDAWIAFFEEFTTRLQGRAEIGAAALVSELPMTATGTPEPYAPTERAADVPWGSRTALHTIVSPGYFDAAGIPLRQGRDFSHADRDGATPVAVIDEAMARRLLRERAGPLLGRRLDVTAHEFRSGYGVARRTVEVVGVAGVVPHDHPDAEPPGTIYLPHAQHALWSMAVLVRGVQGDAPLLAARDVLREMDGDLPVISPQPLEAVVARVMAPTRFLLALLGFFGFVAIGLTAVALYGVVAESVRQRWRELGIRIAVGAVPASLTRRVLLDALALAAMGTVPGALLAPVIGRMIERAVVTPDGVVAPALVVAGAVLAAVAMAACYPPARRAARVNPAEALRAE